MHLGILSWNEIDDIVQLRDLDGTQISLRRLKKITDFKRGEGMEWIKRLRGKTSSAEAKIYPLGKVRLTKYIQAMRMERLQEINHLREALTDWIVSLDAMPLTHKLKKIVDATQYRVKVEVMMTVSVDKEETDVESVLSDMDYQFSESDTEDNAEIVRTEITGWEVMKEKDDTLLV